MHSHIWCCLIGRQTLNDIIVSNYLIEFNLCLAEGTEWVASEGVHALTADSMIQAADNDWLALTAAVLSEANVTFVDVLR